MTARLALVLAVLAGCTITPADAAPTQTAPVSGLPAAAVATQPAAPVAPRTTLPAPTTTVAPTYTHPDPNVERWHALALAVGWPEAEWEWLSCVVARESNDVNTGTLTLPLELEQLELALEAATGRRLVVVVPCSAAKLGAPTAAEVAAGWAGHRAGDLYLGSFHRYARHHAERLGADEVLILSAGHGLLRLDRHVAAYDTRIEDLDSIVATPGKVAHQAATFGLLDPDVVVVSFCPAAYTRELRKAIPALLTPLEGSRGIGEQRGRLNRIEALR